MSTSPIEFSFEASPELGQLAARQYIRRTFGTGLILLAGIAIGCTVAAVMGYQEWYVIVGLVISYGPMWQWFGYYRRSGANFQDRPHVTVRLTDENFELEMEGRFSRWHWNKVKSVWRSRDVWVFFPYQDGPFTPIPTEQLNAAAQDLIEDSVIKNGGTID